MKRITTLFLPFLSFLLFSVTSFANDECSNAILLQTPSAGAIGSCGIIQSGNLATATRSANIPSNVSSGWTDVWYKFTATKTAHIITVRNINSSIVGSGEYALQLTAIRFNNCAGVNDSWNKQKFELTRHGGGDRASIANIDLACHGLVIGDTYLVNVAGLTDVTFDICVSTPSVWANEPINDLQSNILTLSSTTNNHNGTLNGASGGVSLDLPDVFYNFVATQTTHTITLSNIVNERGLTFIPDLKCYVWNRNGGFGVTGILNENFTNQVKTYTLSGLTVGSDYGIQIYCENTLFENFTISIDGLGTAPSSGNAAVFNGTSSYVESPEGEAGNVSVLGGMSLNVTSFTMETWVKFNNPATGQNDWIAEIGSTSNGVNTWFWYNNNNTFGLGNNKIVVGFSGMNNGAGVGDFTYNFTPIAGTWYHLAYTYDEATKTVNLFINGVSQGQKTNTGATRPNFVTRPSLHLGKRIVGGVTSHFLDGSLDEFRLWNFAKTQAQVQAQYQTELTGNESGLVTYYKFDETGTCDIADCTPNRYDANGIITRTPSTVPTLTDVACGADPSVSGYKEFVGRLNGNCANGWNDASNWSPSGVPTSTDNVLIRHGMVAIPNGSTPIVINSLTLDGANAAIFNNSGSPQPLQMQDLIWKAGQISTNIRTYGSGSVLSDNRMSKRLYNANWDNYGTVTWIAGYMSINNASIANQISGTFDINGSGAYGIRNGGTNPRTFYNYGMFRSRGNTTTSNHFFGTSYFYNSGTIKEESYALGVYALDNIGTLDIGAGFSIWSNFNNRLASTSQFPNTGTLLLGWNSIIDGTINMGNSNLWINANTDAVTGVNTPKIVSSKRIDFTNGRLAVPLEVQATGTLNLMPFTNNYDKIIASTIINDGTTNWTGGNIKLENGTIQNNKLFNVNLPKGSTNSLSSLSGTNLFVNCGKVDNQSNTPFSVPYSSCNQAGVASKISGIGTLTFAAPLITSDIISPGNSPGSLTINPSVTTTSSAVFDIEIFGGFGTSGIQDDADLLLSAGNIQLNGTLKLTLNNAENGNYTIVNSSGGTVSGTFSSILYSVNGAAFTSSPPAGISVSYLANAVRVAVNIPSKPLLAVKVILQGCYNTTTQLMNDDLRSKSLIPLTEPYTGITGFTHVGGGGSETITPSVLGDNAANSIVDWVFLELRDKNNAASVLATRSALLQRDGDVVDIDGVSPLSFNVAAGDYFVSVRHRNHLGARTSAAKTLSTTSAVVVDFTDFTAPTAIYGTNSQKVLNSKQVLWMGNVKQDGILKYSGLNNDRLPILTRIGGTNISATVNGYLIEDCNMDGIVKYSGLNNDRLPILNNIGGTNITATLMEQL